jgi:hypothetical protein
LYESTRPEWSEVRDYEESVANPEDQLRSSIIRLQLGAAAVQRLASTGRSEFSIEHIPDDVAREAHVDSTFAYIQPAADYNVALVPGLDWTGTTLEGGPVEGRDDYERHADVSVAADLNSLEALSAQAEKDAKRLDPENTLWGCSPQRIWSIRINGPSGENAPVSEVQLRIVVNGHRSPK